MMLSTNPPTLQQRQQFHRRQNSTPTIPYEAMKVPALTAPRSGLQRQNSHRRGQSLDQRSPIRRPRSQYEAVSITNKGTTTEQQILREAQQQRIAPGQRYQPIQSPHCGVAFNDTDFQDMQSMPMNACMYNQMMMNTPMQAMGPSHYSTNQMPMSTRNMVPMVNGYDGLGLGLDENAGQNYFQQNHQVIYDMPEEQPVDTRRMSQPELQVYGQRPRTPTQQVNNARFPLTPATTPFRRVNQAHISRTAQSSPTKQHYSDDTLKPAQPMQRGRSLQSIFEGSVPQHSDLPSPPGTAPLTSSSTFDCAMMPTPGLGGLDDFENDPFEDDLVKHGMTGAAHASSPSASSYQSTPDLPQHATFEDSERIGRPREIPRMLPSSQTLPDLTSTSSSPIRAALSPRRMSISDLNLEPGISASITETDVTLDDIAQFIEGPDPVDNKWVCKYDDCDKRFGRKENIKSHIQTHLGDRQFKCDHCQKCFVRGHDLKRHAKIHSGAKPYPCLCGNSFARHDALTRHRQRGMCIGAFDGVVKKVIKRGRPRKHRPEMEERLDKASRTRDRADHLERQHYASSCSDSGASSYHSPPAESFDQLSIRGSSPFDEMTFIASQSNEEAALTADFFSFTPPASPGYSTGNKPSPMHQPMTPTDLASIHDAVSSPVHRYENTMTHQSPPPSLCHSSSSPVAEANVFDFVDGMMPTMSESDDMTLKDIDRSDFDSFFDYGAAIPEHDDFFAQL